MSATYKGQAIFSSGPCRFAVGRRGVLLRPLGVETLATLVYARANVSLFAEASLPALGIVVVGLIPVLLSTHFSQRQS